MTTSLAQQLQKLAVPQTGLYIHEKKKVSLLFDPKEAATIDRETFFEIGLSGLAELKKINNVFSNYENSLFSATSKDFERAMQTAEVNSKIDITIKSFLTRLSPYLLLQCSHKALEWLINRYQIHKYNKDDFMKLILPYHETKIFVRCIQLMKLKGATERWNFLEPLKKPGIPLAKIVLFNHCASNPSMLSFISEMTLDAVLEFEANTDSLSTLLAFYCSTIVGTFEQLKFVSENHMGAVLPVLLKSFSSSSDDFIVAGYMITAQLAVKTQLKDKTIRHLVNKLFSVKDVMKFEKVFLMQIIYQYQDSCVPVSEKALVNVTTNEMVEICSHLNRLIKDGHDPVKFIKAFVTGSLNLIQKHSENKKRFSGLVDTLIDTVDMSNFAQIIIKCCIDEFTLVKKNLKKNVSSDLEVIELDSDKDDEEPIKLWYSQHMKSLEKKYPTQFDTVLKEELRSKDSEIPISAILGFTPKLVKKLGNSYLFEKLYHENPLIRNEAVKYIIQDLENLLNANTNFVKESIVDRFRDDDPNVILTLLSIDTKTLIELISKQTFIELCKDILHKKVGEKSWLETIHKIFQHFYNFQKDDLDDKTCLTILPYMFSSTEEELAISSLILKSALGQSLLSLDEEFNVALYHTSEALSEAIFDIMEKGVFSINTEFAINVIKTGDYLSKLFALYILATNIQNISNENSMSLFKEIVNSMKNCNLTTCDDPLQFNGTNMTKFIHFAVRGELPIQIFAFYMEKILKKKGLCHTAKGAWVDFEKDFKKQCYETIVYHANKNYGTIFNPLLRKFFESKFEKNIDKIEFVSNFISHNENIISNKKDLTFDHVIQIRSLRIMEVMCGSSNLNDILNSTIVIPSLLICLNNPNLIVRKHAMGIINIILKKEDKVSKEAIFTSEFLLSLNEKQEEILLDHQQICFVLSSIFAPKMLRKKSKLGIVTNLKSVVEIIKDSKTPHYIRRQLIAILNSINKEYLIGEIASVGLQLLEKSESHTELPIDESLILKQMFDGIDQISGNILKEDNIIWIFLKKSLQNITSCLKLDSETIQPLFSIIAKEVSEEFFGQLQTTQAKNMLKSVLYAGSYAQNSAIISSVSKFIKRIELDSEHVNDFLNSMVTISDQTSEVKKRKSISIPPPQILNSQEWKLGITLLENIQDKKKFKNVVDIIPHLFNVLKKCLQFEEQSLVEYTKQLLLTCILNCLEKVESKFNNKTQLNKLINIESIVMCVRGTQNPQTHHHALMLLAHASRLLPEEVLNHIMAIFTFIGSSVLRQDDEYSFQIINRIIESIIPILVGMEGTPANLEKKVIPLLRIFADVTMDVPEHRRLPVYKILLSTLNPSDFLWSFLCLVFESHVVHGSEDKLNTTNNPRGTESAPTRIDFASSLILEFSPDVIFKTCNKIVTYIKSLPIEKPEEESTKEKDSDQIFSVSSHTDKQLRHYKYVTVTFVNSTLSSALLLQQLNSCSQETMEENYKSLIVNILTYIQAISKCVDENVGKPRAKYWKVMLHHCYEILDSVNMLLSVEMFIMVVRGLLSHNLLSIRRKSMEILNTKLQHQSNFFAECPKETVYTLLPPLLATITNVENESLQNNPQKLEIEVNQQTALLSIKLLVRLLAQDDPMKFKPILELVTTLMHLPLSANLMASVVLCLAELCSNLKAHSIAYLPKFMPSLIKTLKTAADNEAPELVILSIITAIHKIVDTIPLFLSPYLEKLLYELSVLSGKLESAEQTNKNTPIVNKLAVIKSKISTTITPRILIPVVSRCYNTILKKGKYGAVGPVMGILAESFAGVTSQEFASLQQDLTQFFLSALQFRNDYANYDDTSSDQVDTIEGHVLKALVTLVLKLSESSFRPLYFKIYDWAVRSPTDETKDRAITFYRLSSEIANSLKGLFVLFAGHFVKNASDLLDACNKSKTESLFFESSKKSVYLVENILRTFHFVFLYDSQNFVNKDRFETIMQPLVDQLENDLKGIESLKTRAKELIIPCIAQFAVATADDSLWKPLNYQILLKTRHNDSEIRLLGLECVKEMATKLGDSWLPLLPETVPFLAELLEDEIPEVEAATQKAIQTLEAVLGEPLQKYF